MRDEPQLALIRIVLLLLVWIATPLAAQTPQGTAFTYQGQLRQNGVAVNGNVDFVFRLFDAPNAGNAVGPILDFTSATSNAVAVNNGVFKVTLDFGALTFNTLVTDERYLDITVNGNLLAPRTKIENAPYALQARTAELAYAVSNSSVGSAQIDSSQVQKRVTGACSSGSSIASIAVDGSVGCQAGTSGITQIDASTGLVGGGVGPDVALGIANPLQLTGTDANGVVNVYNTTTSGYGRAIVGTSDADTGSVIRGNATTMTGNTTGVAGVVASPSSNGVLGINSATTGTGSGVIGESASTDGNGVYGVAFGTSGLAWGVWGSTASPDGSGVDGTNTATSGNAYGVSGWSGSSAGIGVYGTAPSADANGGPVGVLGTATASPNGFGVQGYGGGIGVYGVGTDAGVYGTTASIAPTYHGVVPAGVTGGATATSGWNTGVLGYSTSVDGRGVEGVATATMGSNGVGVYAEADGDNGTAVYATGGSMAVYASSASGYALYANSANGVYSYNNNGSTFAYLSTPTAAATFYGLVNVIGTLTKSAGTFRIDHPLDPANKYLSHSFVESPDMKNVYDGVATLDQNGQAWVELPSYFEALNRDFRYQLTALDAPAPSLYIADRVSANRFRIAGGTANQQVSWQVTGTRHDAYAEAHRVVAEEDKLDERGHYLSPELFDQPATTQIGAAERIAVSEPAVASISPRQLPSALAAPRSLPQVPPKNPVAGPGAKP